MVYRRIKIPSLNKLFNDKFMNILYVHGYNGDPYGSSFQRLKEAIGEDHDLFSVDYDANNPVGAIECIKNAIDCKE